MAKVKRRKSSVSARERRLRRAKAARQARRGARFEHELRRRYDELFGADTSADRAAEVWLERLDGGAVPVKLSRVLAATASEEHARAVATEMGRLSAGSVPALSLGADTAFQLDGDARRASALINRALDAAVGMPARVTLAEHLVELGRGADALTLVEQRLLDSPEDEDARRVYADALELAHWRLGDEAGRGPDDCPCWSGRSWSECCRDAERHALDRFADRRRLDSLSQAMRRFTALEADVCARVEAHVEEWLERAGEFTRDAADVSGALTHAAGEHAWMLGSEDQEGDDDAPLTLFAASRSASPEDAAAARRWLEHCEYGLWQVSDPTPSPGVWMVDLVTSRRRYVAIAPEHLEGMGRWTVLLGALVAIDGVWRTPETLVPLGPAEADRVAELAEEFVCHLLSAESGEDIKRPSRNRWREEPAGVLAAQTQSPIHEVASFVSMVVATSMPELLAFVAELRARTPQLVNTDKDTICLINATVRVSDPQTVVERLADHPDLEQRDEELTWWGREMDEFERAGTEAEVRALMRTQGEEFDPSMMAGPQRWIRGRVKACEGGLEIDVNSRERLARFLDVLRELGEQPEVCKQLAIDPTQDLPQRRAGHLLSVGGSVESQATWLAYFPDQPLPALDGRTPREAAHRERDAARLEAVLRELEHDADILAGRGMPAPDIDLLREELQAPVSAWLY